MISTHSYAQIQSRDFGLFIGTSQYNGDVNMSKAYYSPHIAASVVYRQTYNPHYSWRNSFTYGELKGYDEDFSPLYQYYRDHSFSDNTIFELASVVEFNFFEITMDEKEKNFSPYVVGGMGIFRVEDITLKHSLVLPLGVGLKYRILPQYELCLEWAFRKTFTDRLDLLDAETVGYQQFKQHSFKSTKDWYSILGITLLYSVPNNTSPCPIYDKKAYEYTIKKRR